MATAKSDTFTAQEAGKLTMGSGIINTSVLSMTCEYEATALAANDVIDLFRLPKGAVIKDIILDFDALGTGTSMDVGDGADADRFIDGATTTAAGTARLGVIDGRNYRVGTNDGDDVITATMLGAAGTGTIKATVFYAI